MQEERILELLRQELSFNEWLHFTHTHNRWYSFFTCFYTSRSSQKLSVQKWLLTHSEIISRLRSVTEIFLALVSEDCAEFIKGWSWRRSVTAVCLCSSQQKGIFSFCKSWVEKAKYCPISGEKMRCHTHELTLPGISAIRLIRLLYCVPSHVTWLMHL